MKSMLQKWQRLADRIDAMSLRERALIFAALATLLISLVNALLIEPQLARQKTLSEQIVQTQQTTAAMHQQIQSLLKLSMTDPNAALKTRLAGLRGQSDQSGQTLQNIQNHLVSPQQMPDLLKTLLSEHDHVQLVSLKTLSVELLDEATENDKTGSSQSAGKQDKPANAAPHVYKHGVEISLSGSYADLVDYLDALERSPWRMFWGKASLTTDQDHHLQLTLRLYTLSQDQAWLTI